MKEEDEEEQRARYDPDPNMEELPPRGVTPVHGVMVLDKAAGVSSAKALVPLKRELPRKTKVGHAGTLDPFATGVLLALVGDATRLSDLAMALPKTYIATVKFGVETDTLDPEGQVVAEADPGEVPSTWPLEQFLGEIEQVPPVFSALKVDGKRAYKLARAGEAPAMKSRRVRIDELRIVEERWPEVVFEVRCGRGTYIRSLARDLGAALGLPASLTALRRTAIGPFLADESGVLHAPITMTRAAGLPPIELDLAQARAIAEGRMLPVKHEDGPVAVVWDDLLLGLGEVRRGRLHARTILSAARVRVGERGSRE